MKKIYQAPQADIFEMDMADILTLSEQEAGWGNEYDFSDGERI